MSTCDKCGLEVQASNDASVFDIIQYRMMKLGLDYVEEDCDGWDYTYLIVSTARHLLPVKDGEKVVCPGSPSRCQYLEGHTPDERTAYKYDPAREALYRAAYKRLVEDVGPRLAAGLGAPAPAAN